MKTIILAIAITTIFSLHLIAQDKSGTTNNTSTTTAPVMPAKKLSVSVGLEAGIPTKKVADVASFTTGVSVQGEYKVLKELGVTLSANYLYFMAKDGHTGLSFIPVMGGVKYYAAPKFYLSGQAGPSFYAGKNSANDVYLTYAAGLGYKTSKRIDLMVKYEGVNVAPQTNYSLVGLRVAYTFW